MAENSSATKTRAKRIELHYFKRLHPLRRWKLLLSIAAPLIVALWLGVHGVRGDQRIYTSGPLSSAHAMFWTRCSDCHGPRVPGAPAPSAKAFFVKPNDQACLACHDAPIHHESQAFNPGCTSCHVEHKGRVELAVFGDAQCVRCHADLRTKERTPSAVAPKIRDFVSTHPEFAVAVREKDAIVRVRLDRAADLKDTAQIKLNHQKHLVAGLRGIEDFKALRGSQGIVSRPEGLQLGCAVCHQPDASRASMQPISYVTHCAACHPLDVDSRLPGAVAPHDPPPIVHAYLRSLFIETFERCQALPKDPEARRRSGMLKSCQDLELAEVEPRGRRPEQGQGVPDADEPRGRRLLRSEPADEPPPRGLRGRSEEPEKPAPAAGGAASALEWASTQLRGVERIMFNRNCELCHTIRPVSEGPPEVAPTVIPARWLPRSVFNHGAHRPLTCTECHKATVSKQTTDVLIPSVAVCRDCHRERGGARTACVECHRYHDKTKERDPSGPFAIQDLAARSSSPRSRPK